jgi:hypothetical protein
MKKLSKHDFSDIKDIINASEIGQYQYCSISWFLQKYGYKPRTPMLTIGLQKHNELGKIIDITKSNTKKSKLLLYISFLTFFIATLIFFIEVIL